MVLCGVWVVDISIPFSDEFSSLAFEKVGPAEKKRALSYVFKKDQDRALASALLQRKAVTARFSTDQYTILRSREVFDLCYNVDNDVTLFYVQNKPYLVITEEVAGSYWNFNVSHHGEFVGIAWHENYLVHV
jgi:phosphopantetheinyl transferase